MSGRRRISAGATLAVVVVFGACSTGDENAATGEPTVSAAAGSTTAVPTTSSPTAVTSMTVGPTTSVAATTTTTIITTTTSVACDPIDIVVLGNSTDYWPDYVVGADAPTDDAWPALLGDLLRAAWPDTEVRVENASVLGAGFDIGLYGVTSMSEQLDLLAESHDGRSTAMLLAPSVVDLQLRSLDVDASYDAFVELHADATAAFDHVVVLPMNPVATGADPEIAKAIAGFNRRLVRSGTVAADDRSPLLADDGAFGRPEYYDDFDDGRLDTPGPDPDGLHPDADGHRAIARANVARVEALLPAACR